MTFFFLVIRTLCVTSALSQLLEKKKKTRETCCNPLLEYVLFLSASYGNPIVCEHYLSCIGLSTVLCGDREYYRITPEVPGLWELHIGWLALEFLTGRPMFPNFFNK